MKKYGLKYYHYIWMQKGAVPIRIAATRKPGPNTVPPRGSWVVREFNGATWTMPPFPEVMWFDLKRMQYLGCIDFERDHK